MRIIAGKFRSRTLKAGEHFRPTTDRVRETLFNILQNQIANAIFVDAFAGSGSVGIEAISRGAAKVYFLESNRKALRILEQNLQVCCEDESWRILTMDVWKALDVLPQQQSHVDLFFFDPPYEFSKYKELLSKAALSYPDANLIVEHSTRTEIETPEDLEQIRTVAIGETQISIYKKLLQEQQ